MIYSNSVTKSIETVLTKIDVNLFSLGNVGSKSVFFSITDFGRKDDIIKAINESKTKWTVGRVELTKDLRTGIEVLKFSCHKSPNYR